MQKVLTKVKKMSKTVHLSIPLTTKNNPFKFKKLQNWTRIVKNQFNSNQNHSDITNYNRR